MIQYLKRIIERLRGLRPRLPPFDSSSDPDAGVRHPRRGGGPNRTMAAAVDEPDDARELVAATGRHRRS